MVLILSWHASHHSIKGARVCLQVALLNNLLNYLIAKLRKYVYSLDIIKFILQSKNFKCNLFEPVQDNV